MRIDFQVNCGNNQMEASKCSKCQPRESCMNLDDILCWAPDCCEAVEWLWTTLPFGYPTPAIDMNMAVPGYAHSHMVSVAEVTAIPFWLNSRHLPYSSKHAAKPSLRIQLLQFVLSLQL